METKRMCLFLCAVFLVLNIVFVSMFYAEKNKQEYLNDDYISLISQNLNSNGISIDKKVIINKIPDSSVFSITTQNAQNRAVEISEDIAEIRFPKVNVSATCFETPEGFLVGIYDNQSSDELSKLVYSQNTFSIQYSDKDFGLDINEVKSHVLENDNLLLDVTTEKIIQKFLLQLMYNDSFGYVINSTQIDDGVIYIGVVQTINNKQIKDMQMKLVLSESQVVCATGNWICTDLGKQYKETLTDGASILYQIPDNSIAEILSEEIVYTVRQAGDFVYYLMPAWKIEYKDTDSNNKVVFIDAVSE